MMFNSRLIKGNNAFSSSRFPLCPAGCVLPPTSPIYPRIAGKLALSPLLPSCNS